MNDELEREHPVTIAAQTLSSGDIIGLGYELACLGACFDPFGGWFRYLAWNLTLAALLQTAADRAVLAEDISWINKPLTPRAMEACNSAGLSTLEWK